MRDGSSLAQSLAPVSQRCLTASLDLAYTLLTALSLNSVQSPCISHRVPASIQVLTDEAFCSPATAPPSPRQPRALHLSISRCPGFSVGTALPSPPLLSHAYPPSASSEASPHLQGLCVSQAKFRILRTFIAFIVFLSNSLLILALRSIEFDDTWLGFKPWSCLIFPL